MNWDLEDSEDANGDLFPNRDEDWWTRSPDDPPSDVVLEFQSLVGDPHEATMDKLRRFSPDNLGEGITLEEKREFTEDVLAAFDRLTARFFVVSNFYGQHGDTRFTPRPELCTQIIAVGRKMSLYVEGASRHRLGQDFYDALVSTVEEMVKVFPDRDPFVAFANDFLQNDAQTFPLCDIITPTVAPR